MTGTASQRFIKPSFLSSVFAVGLLFFSSGYATKLNFTVINLADSKINVYFANWPTQEHDIQPDQAATFKLIDVWPHTAGRVRHLIVNGNEAASRRFDKNTTTNIAITKQNKRFHAKWGVTELNDEGYRSINIHNQSQKPLFVYIPNYTSFKASQKLELYNEEGGSTDASRRNGFRINQGASRKLYFSFAGKSGAAACGPLVLQRKTIPLLIDSIDADGRYLKVRADLSMGSAYLYGSSNPKLLIKGNSLKHKQTSNADVTSPGDSTDHTPLTLGFKETAQPLPPPPQLPPKPVVRKIITLTFTGLYTPQQAAEYAKTIAQSSAALKHAMTDTDNLKYTLSQNGKSLRFFFVDQYKLPGNLVIKTDSSVYRYKPYVEILDATTHQLINSGTLEKTYTYFRVPKGKYFIVPFNQQVPNKYYTYLNLHLSGDNQIDITNTNTLITKSISGTVNESADTSFDLHFDGQYPGDDTDFSGALYSKNYKHGFMLDATKANSKSSKNNDFNYTIPSTLGQEIYSGPAMTYTLKSQACELAAENPDIKEQGSGFSATYRSICY